MLIHILNFVNKNDLQLQSSHVEECILVKFLLNIINVISNLPFLLLIFDYQNN